MNSSQVTAYFRHREDAEHAAQELESAGVPTANIEVQSGGGSTQTGFMQNVKRFFGAADSTYASGALVCVRGTPGAGAVDILRRCGGEIGTGAETGAMAADTAVSGEDRLRLHEERLSVNKQSTQAGEVRVRKEVVTENQSVEVPVQHEEVIVERHSAPAGAEGAADAGFEENQEVRIPVMREEVSVEKHPVATEEVSIGKRAVRETQTVGGTVRKERARIETTGDVRPPDDPQTKR